jgi:hypothetical protein
MRWRASSREFACLHVGARQKLAQITYFVFERLRAAPDLDEVQIRALVVISVFAMFNVYTESRGSQRGKMPVNAKKVRRLGRSTGKTQPINLHLRVNREFVGSIDNWRRHQPDLPNRTEAIRRPVGHARRAGFTEVMRDGVAVREGRKSPSRLQRRPANPTDEPHL